MEISSDQLNLNRTCHVTLTDADRALNCISLLVDHVHQIVATHPAPHVLFVSGGVDSQAMIYIWKLAGVPFQACHINYMGYNTHDYLDIKNFCERECVDLNVIDFDVIHFLEHDLPNYAVKYQCASPQICTYMTMSELVEGTPVFAGNIPNINGLSLDNTIFGLQRYAVLSGRPMVPFFLMGTPDSRRASLVQSMPLSQDAFTYERKCEHYEHMGIPIIRQAEKYTGFEHIKLFYDHQHTRVTPLMKISHAHLPSQRVFDQLFRNKYLIAFRNHYTIKLTHNVEFFDNLD